MKARRPICICATSIAAFLASVPVSPGNSYSVDLGDTFIVPGLVTGATGLTKTGGGTLVLTNAANNYTGVTTISNGTVVITNPSALGAETSAIGVTGFNPTIGQATNVRGFGGGSLVLSGLLGGMNLTRDLSLQGQGPIADRGGALISLGNNTLSGAVTTAPFAPGTTTPINTAIISARGLLTLSGPLVVQPAGIALATTTTFGGVNQGGVANYNLTGQLTGTGILSKQGGGTLFLNPSSSAGFSGSIRTNASNANGQSSVRISTPNVLGTRTGAGTNAVLDLNGGLLEILMDSPSVLAGGIPAHVYGRSGGAINAQAIFADKSVGGSATGGTVAFGQFAHEENQTFTVNSRNGYGMSFGASPVQGGNNNSTFNNNLQGGLLTFTGNFWSNTDNGANRTFTLGGNGDTLIDGNIVATAAAFDHSFTKTGTGTLTVRATGTTLDGNFNINEGTVATRRIVGGLLGVISGTAAGNLNLGSGATTGTLNYLGSAGSGAGETIFKNLNLAGTSGGARINANQAGSAATALILTSVTAANNTSKTLTLGGTSTLRNEIQGGIPNSGTSSLSLAKTDGGAWVLSGTNTYTGTTTISNGDLRLRATSGASQVLPDTSVVTFNVDANQAAGGRIVLEGVPFNPATEVMGNLNPVNGHGTVRVENAGATTTLAIGGLTPNSGTVGSSINFQAPTVIEFITLAGAVGFVRGNTYFNSANFAYGDVGTVLRAPVYGTDAGFANTTGILPFGLHSNIVGPTVSAANTVPSLRFQGSQTLTLSGTVAVNVGTQTVGGILVDGGNAVIAQGGGGAISQGLGAAATGGAPLAFRINQLTDSLALQVPITSSSTQGFSKNGLGTLILSAANNQTGTTNINEGTVRLAPGGRLSAPNQSLAIRQGATLDLNGVTQPSNTIAAFNGAGTVTNSSATPAELTVGNNNGAGIFSGLIQDGVGRVSLLKVSTNDTTLTGLSTYTGATTITSIGALHVTELANIGSPSGIGQGNAASATTNADSLIFAGAQPVSAATGVPLPGGLVYLGTTTGTTDRLFRLGGTGNGAGARLAANSPSSAPLILSNTAPIGYTAAGATAAQTLVLISNNTADNRIDLQLVNSGAPGGSLAVTKSFPGKWVLGNSANSYTGATKIVGGSLEALDGTTLPASSPLLIGSALTTPTGGVFESRGVFTRAVSAGTVANTVNFNANGNFAGSGGFAAAGDTLTVNLGGASAPLTWGGGGFLMAGTGAATLRLSSTTAFGEVDFQNPIDLGAVSRVIQVDDNTNIGADFATLSGALSGAGGGINKIGTGTLALSGDSTYTGATRVTAGTLVVRSLGDSANPGPSSVGDSTAGNTDSGAVLLGNGETGGGILQYVGTGETSDRKIRLNTTTGITQIHSDGSGPLILTNVANDVATGAKTLALRGTNAAGNRIDNVLTDAPIGGGTAALPLTVTVDGSATWILTAANQHSGNTNANAGALGLGHDAALGFGTLVLNNGNVFASGGDRTIANPTQLQNNTTQGFLGDHSLTFTAPLINAAAANNVGINNNIAAGESLNFPAGMNLASLTANRTLTIDGPGQTVFGNINNTSTTALGLNIVKTGTGTLVLDGGTGNFTQNGVALDIDNGLVRLGATNALRGSATSAANVIFSPDTGQNETATLNLNGFSQTIGALTATGTSASTIDNASGSAVTLTVGDNNGAAIYNGAITNSGGGPLSLVKAGTNAGNLSGTNIAYTGTTTVQFGSTLSFTQDDPDGTSGIDVAGGGGLRLINGAGSNFASLTSLSLGAAASVTSLGLDVGTVTDTLAIAGAATTSGTVNLSIGAAPGFGSSPTYTLLSAASGLSGASYALNGIVPGGYTYSLTTSDTAVILNAAVTAGGQFRWRGDVSGSWSTYQSGNTNWVNASGGDPTATPGPRDTVIFSDSIVPPTGPAVVTTLDLPVAIDHLVFNGSNTSTASARVMIAAGLGSNTLTIAPTDPGVGIDLPNSAGTATISAPIVLAADQAWSVGSLGTLRPELVVTGILSGAGHLVKSGGGTATITGNNVRTGRTSIVEGTLRINAEAALGADPGTFDPNHLTIDGGTLRATAGLTIDDSNRGITIGSLGGTIDTTAGSITLGTSAIVQGPGRIRKEGGNSLILNAANSYTGGTLVNGGLVRAGHSTAFGTEFITLATSGTILELSDGVNVANPLNVLNELNDKTIRLQPGATSATYSGNIAVFENTPGNFRAQASAGGTLTISGGILEFATGVPGLRVNEAPGNTGTVVLAGPAGYEGHVEVRQGTLRNGASDAIGGAVTVNAALVASPTATYDVADHNETLNALTFGASASSSAPSLNVVTGGTGTLTLAGNVTTIAGNPNSRAELNTPNVVMAATSTFSVANAANEAVDFIVAGVLSGPGAVTKAGLGTMKIRGQAVYTGVTTVTAGRLLVEGSISGAVNVSGGTLGGTGSVGALTASFGAVAPGESIGTLTAASLTMNSASTFALEIDTSTPATDLLTSLGPVTLSLAGTPLTIADLGGNFALTEGARFRFITYSGGQTGRFSFAGNVIDDDIEHFAVGMNTFAIDYNDLGGTAISLVVVPEPGVAGSLLGGVALLAGFPRRRPRRA